MPAANSPRTSQNRQRFVELSPHYGAFFLRISGEIQHYIHMSRPARTVLLRRFGRPALRASTKLRRRRRLLKARYKFGIARTRERTRKRTEGGGRGEGRGRQSRAFMIAIMPNTISREILSAGGRATARVANRAKNNNEMSDGEQDRTAERMAENRVGRAKRRPGEGGK